MNTSTRITSTHTTSVVVTSDGSGFHTCNMNTAGATSSLNNATSAVVTLDESRYHVCGGCMHAQTGAYFVGSLHIAGLLILLIYQLGIVSSVRNKEAFGPSIYIPPVLTVIFFAYAIAAHVYLVKGLNQMKSDHLNVMISFVFFAIFFFLFLSIITVMAFTMEGTWLNFMRVQLEATGRNGPGMPESKDMKVFRKDMTTRFGILLFVFMCATKINYLSFNVVETCQIYVAEQASNTNSNNNASYNMADASSRPLISTNSAPQQQPPVIVQTPLYTSTIVPASEEDHDESPPSYNEVTGRKTFFIYNKK